MVISVELLLLPICMAWERAGEVSIGRVMMVGWEAEGRPGRTSPEPATSRVCAASECCTRRARRRRERMLRYRQLQTARVCGRTSSTSRPSTSILGAGGACIGPSPQ